MNATFGLADLAVDDAQLAAWLREDAPFGDLTSTSLLPRGAEGVMRFAARRAMSVAGIEEAARLVQLAGGHAALHARSGERAEPAQPLLEARGSAQALLLAWKVAQTLVEAASGIATATAEIVELLRAEGFTTPLACTRKNFPGTRAIAAKAVRAGGGVMHRLGLSETLLVFPEHRAFLPPESAGAAVARLAASQPEKRVVVEVGSEDEAVAMARAGAHVIQLERFAPAALAALRERLRREGLHVLLAPAGGVTRDNALAYARAGADLLVSSAPYFAPPADVQVSIAAQPPR
ncbi:MAG: ModD protein [Piscinibacter sp.]